MFRTGSVRTSIHHGELSAAGVISRESKFTCQRDKDEGPRIFLEDEGEEPICRIKPAGHWTGTYKVDAKDMYYCFASLELEASLADFLRPPTFRICIRSRVTSNRINQLNTNSLIAQRSSKIGRIPSNDCHCGRLPESNRALDHFRLGLIRVESPIKCIAQG